MHCLSNDLDQMYSEFLDQQTYNWLDSFDSLIKVKLSQVDLSYSIIWDIDEVLFNFWDKDSSQFTIALDLTELVEHRSLDMTLTYLPSFADGVVGLESELTSGGFPEALDIMLRSFNLNTVFEEYYVS